MKYIRTMHPFLNRLQAVWFILTRKEFILLSIHERKVHIKCRTNFDKTGDLAIIEIAKLTLKERV